MEGQGGGEVDVEFRTNGSPQVASKQTPAIEIYGDWNSVAGNPGSQKPRNYGSSGYIFEFEELEPPRVSI